MYEVYVHTSPSGKSYVGYSVRGAEYRWRRGHVPDARAGKPSAFHCAIRKYGPAAFSRRVLDRLSTEAGAKRAEVLWIRELDTFRAGYNETTGGDGVSGAAFTHERRAAIGTRNRARVITPEWRANLSAAGKGRRISAACRDAVRASNTRRVWSESSVEKARESARLRWAKKRAK